MKFDPATLLTTAFLTLLLFGGLIAFVSRNWGRRTTGLWWLAGFSLGACGFLVLVVGPSSSPMLTIVCNSLFLSAYGCTYAAARSLVGRAPILWSLALAVGVWPVTNFAFDLSFELRVVLFSLLVCVFSTLIAFEFVRGRAGERHRNIAAILCTGHALFYLVRAVAGPTMGFANASSQTALSLWGAIIALEIVLFAGALAVLVVSIMINQASMEERRAAYTDFLTGIGNRRSFETEMQDVISANREGMPDTLLLLDLDNFKEVNDLHGHDAGDELLRSFAKMVQDELADASMFWRLGGDEFAILISGKGPEEIRVMGDQLRRIVDLCVAKQPVEDWPQVSVSIGHAVVERFDTPTDILRRADAVLYQDKRHRGRSARAKSRRDEKVFSASI